MILEGEDLEMNQIIHLLFFIPPIALLLSLVFQKRLSKKVDILIRLFFSVSMLLFVILVLTDVI